MAGLCLPLPTLRRRPRGRQRTARGRCGARNLHRRGLSPHAPRRSPGALQAILFGWAWPGLDWLGRAWTGDREEFGLSWTKLLSYVFSRDGQGRQGANASPESGQALEKAIGGNVKSWHGFRFGATLSA